MTLAPPASEAEGSDAAPTPDCAPSRWDRLPRWHGRCRSYRYAARREGIGLVNAIIEGYDDLARVRTEDPHAGILSILVPEDSDADFRAIVGALSAHLEVKEMPLI